ncbi:CDP-glucose 4,6-dehydratase, partial [mine drainage metagenome]
KELVELFVKQWGAGSYAIQNMSYSKEANYLQLDVSKAKKELNWSPRYDFETSVKKTVEWYKSYYNNPRDIDTMTTNQLEEYSLGANYEG